MTVPGTCEAIVTWLPLTYASSVVSRSENTNT
jgi:hypothetical protein